jgi:cysteine desulfurase / selenocysteine lyase
MIDWNAVRAEFPALQRYVYLNTATFGQLPARAVEAVARHFAHRDELACADFLNWFDDADRLRESIARFIHCEAVDIAFVPSAAHALSTLIGGLCWRSGDQILTLENEFPNNIYHPALLETRGVEFVETSCEKFFDAVTERTRMVAVSSVNYVTGLRVPLEEVSRFLKQRGILFYVDGTQSVGALEFNTAAVQPDMLAVHGYKWLLCPNGAGFAYVSPLLRASLPPSVVGWRSHQDWRSVDYLHHGAPVFKNSAERYEGGMLSFAVLYAMQASLDLLLELGATAIHERVMQLATYARARLQETGASVLYSDDARLQSPVLAAQWQGLDASRLARELADRRILVSARHGRLRVSTHFYNLEQDVDLLCDELRRLL